MNSKEKVALAVAGIEIIGCLAFSIYCYGKYKYYDGRISKNKELQPIIDSLHEELEKVGLKSGKEA